MRQWIGTRIRLMDKWLLIPYLIMVVFSIIMVYSASSYSAMQDFGNSAHYLIRQTIYVVASILVLFTTSFLSLKKLKSKPVIMGVLGVTILLLFSVLLFGREINGAKRWLQLPFINIQPGEIAKVVVVWYMAYILSKRETGELGLFFHSIKGPLLLILGIAGVIFLQPDTGTTVIILAVTTIMIFASGINFWIGVVFSGVGAVSIFAAMELIRRFGESLPFISGYRYDRFLAFWDPFALSDSHGLQLVNSYYALSRGGLTGVGLGNSVQKTGYLPFPYTDFIMAIVGEEFGLIGIIIVLAIFALIVSRIFLIGIRSKTPFRILLCYGVGILLTIQSLFNMGGVVGLMPITGLTFPFLSFGGSSLLILSFAVGLVLNISINNKRDQLIQNS